MSTEFRPLVEVLRELRSHAQKNASGFMYIVTDENHSCMVRLHDGQIEEVMFRMLRDDEAVQRLTMVATAKARFQTEMGTGAGKASRLSDASRQWLLGGFERDLADLPAAASHAGTPVSAPGVFDARARAAIEEVALNFLGPIAGMLCDEAFEATSDPQRAIDKLAVNLSTPQEQQSFAHEAREALLKLR